MRWIGFALLLCACSSSRSYSTGEQSEEELREILARRDVLDSALALNDAVYAIGSAQLSTERNALLAALAEAPVDRSTPPFRVEVDLRKGVKMWPRSEVLELAYEDGVLHIEQRPDRTTVVAFEKGNETRWMDLQASAPVRQAWRAHADAARRKSRAQQGLHWAERPLRRMRDIGIDAR
ncbi:MAG: hypothetical protein ACYTEG_09255 [Planctomycetota bacterium]